MSDEHHNEPFEHPLLNRMPERAKGKTELALQYDRATTLDDLLVIVSERVCFAAFHIMSCFRLPKRGRLILRLLKCINRSSYDRYWKQSNRLFSECTMFVTAKIRDFINQNCSVCADDHFFDQMTSWAGVQWYTMIKMSPDEIEQFKNDMTNAATDFFDNLPANQSEAQNRIINALGRKPRLSEISEFVKAITLLDPLGLIEPTHFVRNYERLF